MKFSQIVYQRPDFEKLEQQFMESLEKLTTAKNLSQAVESIKFINNIRKSFISAMSVATIRYCMDTRDEFYSKEREFYNEAAPRAEALLFRFYEALIKSSLRDQLERIFGTRLFNIAEMTIKTFVPEILEDLIEENKLSNDYAKLISSAKIQFDGRQLTLPQLKAFEMSPERDVRKRACEARYQFFAQNERQLDEIYDQLVKVRHRIATKLGFKSFVPVAYLRMKRSDYSPQDVKSLRDVVQRHVVPLIQNLRNQQRKILQIDELKYYDRPILLRDGNPRPQGDLHEIVKSAKTMYEQMSKHTKEFFDYMLDNGLMDLESREGKYPGGFCDFIPDHGMPFIFANFNGTAHDVDVLTHEAGHAFQVYRSRHFEVPEYYWPTAEACEIHSMGMEFFAWPWLELFYKERAEEARLVHAWGGLNFIAYGVSVDEFQHVVYEDPSLTPEERRKVWRQIEMKYMPEIDYEGNRYLESGGFWQQQAHIYESPFYYIDYVIAQLCAMQFLQKFFQDRVTAFDRYLKLCDLGGSLSFYQLLKAADLGSPFNEEVVKSTVKWLYDWIESRVNKLKSSP
ncbi:M3 family oligoendopeptidase [Pseudothermotoga sp.]|nr:M3 family oligoendopeptidase [Pseudothermotoga sp.]MDW8139550.1 M3 family oligoendopeptidase [Pseudothermotoga sp.]